MSVQHRKDASLFQGKRVLIASANEQLAAYFKDFLFEVPSLDLITVRNAGVAMMRIMEQQYDALILDSDLAALDNPREYSFGVQTSGRPAGLEILKFLRRNCTGKRRETPVLMVINNPNFSRVLEARNSGATEIVAMPLSVSVVKSRLRAMMDCKRPFVVSRGYTGPCRRHGRAKVWADEERRLGGLPLRSKARPVAEFLEAV